MPLGPYSLTRLQTLQPTVQPIFNSFLQQAEAAGIPVEVVQGTRTFSEQQAVYDQGRTMPGPVVTKAKPGDSFHQYGLALDVVPVVYKSLPDWNPNGPLWSRLGEIGEGVGLTWGGRWASKDRPHFHLEAAPLTELKAYWEKFRQIMPVTITPTTGGLAIILLIGVVYLFYIRPMMNRSGVL